MLLTASINELHLRFQLVIAADTSMNGLHSALVTKLRMRLPEPSRLKLCRLRVFCEGVLCYPVSKDEGLKVGSLQALVVECRPVWLDL